MEPVSKPRCHGRRVSAVVPVDAFLRHGGDGGHGAAAVASPVAGRGRRNLDLEDPGRGAVVAVDGADFSRGFLHHDGECNPPKQGRCQHGMKMGRIVVWKRDLRVDTRRLSDAVDSGDDIVGFIRAVMIGVKHGRVVRGRETFPGEPGACRREVRVILVALGGREACWASCPC